MNKKTKQTQLKRTYRAFKEKPKTMFMVSVETGIMRASICRYVATLRKKNKIKLIRNGRDPLTKHKAQFLKAV